MTYYQRNKEKCDVKSALYYQNNKARCVAYQKYYYRRNREIYKYSLIQNEKSNYLSCN